MLKSKDVSLVDGIVDTSGSLATVQIINLGDADATIYSGTPVGTCESFYDKEYADSVNFATTTKDVTDQPPSKALSEHLQDLWERSNVHLSDAQREVLADLLIRYQHVFAQSSEDLGRSDRVQHKINTGVAAPCRQPPRRQPIGKREN